MAYNRKGYLIRAEIIKGITDEYYEPERHDRCYKWVWKYHIKPIFGICYHSYLKYLKSVDEDACGQHQ